MVISTRKNETNADIVSSTNRPVRIFAFTGIHKIMKLNINRSPDLSQCTRRSSHIADKDNALHQDRHLERWRGELGCTKSLSNQYDTSPWFYNPIGPETVASFRNSMLCSKMDQKMQQSAQTTTKSVTSRIL